MPVQTFTTLNDPLAPSGTQPVGINAAGDIVGIYVTATGVDGFLLSGGTYTTIADPLATQHATQALGINDAGQIVGFYANASGEHGFLLSGGTYTTLDDLAGVQASNTVAIGINNAGQIVGTFHNASGDHGFLLSGGTYTTLDDPSAPMAPLQRTSTIEARSSGFTPAAASSTASS